MVGLSARSLGDSPSLEVEEDSPSLALECGMSFFLNWYWVEEFPLLQEDVGCSPWGEGTEEGEAGDLLRP